MEPALHQGDRLVVNKVAYRLGHIERGDVVVVDSDQIPGASPELSKTLVKRVVGLPLESVSALDGRLFIDGSPIDQPWLGDVETLDFGPVVVPPGSVFVLGDNRGSSIDSRNFGAVPTEAIIGRVEGVIWPLSDVGRV
jgi:signal peptidase I